MELEVKAATLKALDSNGEGEALFSLWNTPDLDGDITERGWFGHGQQEVFMIPHHAWTSGEPPIAKGTIFETSEGAVYRFKMSVETDRGRNWHQHLLFDLKEGTAPRQQWSYGFRVVDGGASPRQDGFKGRRLHATSAGQPGALVIEVAPVTAAAQPLSRTLAAKHALSAAEQAHVKRLLEANEAKLREAYEAEQTQIRFIFLHCLSGR